MSRKVTARRIKPKARLWQRKRKGAIALALLLVVVSAVSYTRWERRKSSVARARLAAATGQANPTLSKEYVYAGGRLVAIEEPGPPRSPYPDGVPHAIPGTVEAEDFDEGGEGLTYHDIDPQVANGTYRPGGVYLENCDNRDGGCNVGSAWGGEWLEYTVDVLTAGPYTLEARVASGNGGGGTFRFDLDGSPVTGTLTVPATGGWQVYQTVTASVTLPAGTHVMRLALMGNGAQGGAGNYNYFRFTSGPIGSAPSSLLATAKSNGSVELSWVAATSGGSVDHYEIERTISLADAAPSLFSCSASPCPDPSAVTEKAYLYRVRAVFAGGGMSPYSNQDLGTTAIFVDDPLNPSGVKTTIKGQHFTQLRDAVNKVRVTAGLLPFNWSENGPQYRTTVLASHYNDLRTNLSEALGKLGLPIPQSPAVASRTVISSAPLQELRDLMR